MARSIDARLSDLHTRRKGLDRSSHFVLDSTDAILAKSLLTEEYDRRAPTSKHTKYVLGAMQEVDPEYTSISLREAERVKSQLNASLNAASISHSFELQGSVPANLHIRGISDIDLLVIDGRFHCYDPQGARALAGHYNTPYEGDPTQSLMQIRKNAEDTLTVKFPSANVDKTGAKSVKISGGSLRRPVDVVPANWYDTALYQSTNLARDRGVQILDKLKAIRIPNQPFRHMYLVDLHDGHADGGLKKAIRLCKNIKADADGSEIALSSYDIAATMWHANMAALKVGRVGELAILVETQRHLDALATNHEAAKKLVVPDGSRRIFDSPDKLTALNRLSTEVDDLMLEVGKEQLRQPQYQVLGRSLAREALENSYIP